ncbi:MAG: hypothetical protein LBM13_02000 [Candidatus Ancillula sp.]|nr:hypothetical protein [Candidatus Ancillula sp.]
MFIKLNKSSTSKKIQVQLVENYRDDKGQTRQRVIERYGELSKLEKDNPDILKLLKNRAKLKTQAQAKKFFQISIDINEKNNNEHKLIWGVGFLEKVFNQLGFNHFENELLLSDSLRLNLFSRVLGIGSKELKRDLFGNWNNTSILNPKLNKITFDYKRFGQDSISHAYIIHNIAFFFDKFRNLLYFIKNPQLSDFPKGVLVIHDRSDINYFSSEDIIKAGLDYLFVNLPNRSTPIRFSHPKKKHEAGWSGHKTYNGNFELTTGIQERINSRGYKLQEQVVGVYSRRERRQSITRRHFTINYTRSLLGRQADILEKVAIDSERWDGVRIVTCSNLSISSKQILERFLTLRRLTVFLNTNENKHDQDIESENLNLLLNFFSLQMLFSFKKQLLKANKDFSLKMIRDGILGAACIHFGQGIYRIYEPEETKDLELALNMPLNRKYMKLENLRHFVLNDVSSLTQGF